MRARVAILPGDGVGPELAREAVACLQCVGRLFGHQFTFQGHPAGDYALAAYGVPFLPSTLRACLEADAVLAGAEAGLRGLPSALGAYVGLVPVPAAKPRAGLSVPGLLLVRDPGCAGSISGRLAQYALGLARERGRRQLTVVAEALEPAVAGAARDCPGIAVDRQPAAACAAALAGDPCRFQVLLAEPAAEPVLLPRLAALAGGAGLLGSACLGGAVGLYAPLAGAGPARRDQADPVGAVAAASLLLRHSLGLGAEAFALEAAIADTLAQGFGTSDLPGQPVRVGTRGMGEAIRQNLVRRMALASA